MDFFGLRQRRQQRLRLSDLRHFRRRRKALDRRRKDGVGVGRAAGRLVELGERECRAQLKTPRRLLLRDGDGDREGFSGARGVSKVANEEGVTARPTQLCFEPAIAQAVRCRQRFVEDGDARSGSPARASASASAIFNRESKNGTFRSRSCSTPRRMLSSPPPVAPAGAMAKPSRNGNGHRPDRRSRRA
jgi:hypothetical protein